jgi:hypothetical protein
MNTTKLVVLGLVFLSAILIHVLVIQKEGFNDTITRLTATNVKNMFIETVNKLVQKFNELNKLSDTIKSDKRVKKNRILLANFINNLNDKYSEYEYKIDNYKYDLNNALTLEELTRLKDFILFNVDNTYKNFTDPATANDLETITNRLRNITTTTIPNDLMAIPYATTYFSELNNIIVKISENFTALKRDYNNIPDTNKPVLKSDFYLTFLLDAYDNFDLTKYETMTVPTLRIENIPPSISSTPQTSSTSSSSGVGSSNIITTSNVVTLTSAGSNIGTGSNVTMGWSGDRLKSLFYSLVSYGKVTDKNKTTDTKEEEEEDTTSPYAPASLDDIRDVVRDELKGLKLGPKDCANDKISDRKTKPATDKDKTTTCSDSLSQGSWFRTAANEGCPYAQGQTSSANVTPQPFPIDMNDYIRKDSIPCWGCTLK